MRKLFTALVLAVALGGCATLQNLQRDVQIVWDVATSAKVSPTAVLIAANSFDALEASATNYLRLPRCSAVSGPVCRSPSASRAIIPAVRAGIRARNDLKAFYRDHPGELGPSGLYDALTSSARSIRAVLEQYAVIAVGVNQ